MISIICNDVTNISGNRIEGKVNNLNYHIDVTKGTVSNLEKKVVFRLSPLNGIISLDFSKR